MYALVDSLDTHISVDTSPLDVNTVSSQTLITRWFRTPSQKWSVLRVLEVCMYVCIFIYLCMYLCMNILSTRIYIYIQLRDDDTEVNFLRSTSKNHPQLLRIFFQFQSTQLRIDSKRLIILKTIVFSSARPLWYVPCCPFFVARWLSAW